MWGCWERKLNPHTAAVGHLFPHIQNTVRCCYNAVGFVTNIHKIHPIALRYGVSFVVPASDWYSASISIIINVISYNIGPRYNGTRLHVFFLMSSAKYQPFVHAPLCRDSEVISMWRWEPKLDPHAIVDTSSSTTKRLIWLPFADHIFNSIQPCLYGQHSR